MSVVIIGYAFVALIVTVGSTYLAARDGRGYAAPSLGLITGMFWPIMLPVLALTSALEWVAHKGAAARSGGRDA